MNKIGLKRAIDDLGRIVIPKEFRTPLGIKEGQVMEMVVVGNTIIMSKVNEEGDD